MTRDQLTSVSDLFPFLDADDELHPLWLQYRERVSRKSLWLVVLDDLVRGVERKIRDVASLAVLKYSE